MIKRVSVGLLCLLMLILSTVPVSAEDTPLDFTLIANDAAAGEKVIVTVSIPENSYFTNATMYLHYDPSVVTYVADSVAGGAVSPSFAMVLGNDFPDKSYVKTVYVTVDGIVEGGELITYEFTAKSNAPAQFSLTFDECMGVDGNGVEFTVAPKNDPIIINNDGSVTPSVPSVTTTTAPNAEADGMNVTAILIAVGVVAALIVGITVTMVIIRKKSK